ncbi:membrane protein [Novosphingobium barchaimii LL02]|uniref:Membrane protein n=1 Tax=Novosphingobium barchaimii LL02 TaxID=1114963 RepID=A0A0J7XKL3_9SPHN|nr:DUF805 domain-containing protein [Novosphingobium barchaimii]KMS52536.1 membrane protein [Novosphingobium barchaimii LL02]
MIDEEALRSIEKLYQMKQSGIISDTDFERAKQDLLEGGSRKRSKPPIAIGFSGDIEPYPELPGEQDVGGWAVYPLRRYAVFTGRSCRKEYWTFHAILAVLTIILFKSLPGEDSDGNLTFVTICVIILGGLAVPGLALQVRRFHDQEKTGWFALLNLVPYIGPLIIAGFMLIDGTPGDNQFGPDPKGRG